MQAWIATTALAAALIRTAAAADKVEMFRYDTKGWLKGIADVRMFGLH